MKTASIYILVILALAVPIGTYILGHRSASTKANLDELKICEANFRNCRNDGSDERAKAFLMARYIYLFNRLPRRERPLFPIAVDNIDFKITPIIFGKESEGTTNELMRYKELTSK